MDIFGLVLWVLFATLTFIANVMVGHFAADAFFIWKGFSNHANYRRDYAPSFRSKLLYVWLAAGILLLGVSGLNAYGEQVPETSRAVAVYLRETLGLLTFGLRLRALNKGARWRTYD